MSSQTSTVETVGPSVHRRAVQTIALVGTYQPRRCGIAIFTHDLRHAIASVIGSENATVIAIDDLQDAYAYGDEVKLSLTQHSHSDYRLAADLLNVNQIDCAIIQHEYGIYGGDNGEHILDLITRLRMPVITTLHTLLTEPSPGQRRVLKAILEHSARAVVMTEHGRRILHDIYGAPASRIAVIPHGIHDQPFADPRTYAEQFGLQGKRVLLTFGLMGPGKGLETAIRALPAIVQQHPNTVYLIVGATHPHVLRREGSRYRQSLEQLACDLGVRDHIEFHERFVTVEELGCYLGAADVYVVPYPRPHQVTSGTLAYAIGAGKAVVSTPFWHAAELLADGRGCLFPFNDSERLAEGVSRLLGDDDLRNAMRRRAYDHSRSMLWGTVGRAYLDLAARVLTEHPCGVDRSAGSSLEVAALALENEPALDHILRLTDDTGMLQHARFSTPDRRHGYCTDDNTRALMAVIDHHRLHSGARSLALIDRYLAFIVHAFNDQTRRFRNLMDYQRNWLEEAGSEDSHGRALWALGHAVQHAPQDGQRLLSYQLLKQAAVAVDAFSSPRAWAFTLLGLLRCHARIPIDREVRRQILSLSDRLHRWVAASSAVVWHWPEPTLTYDNARIAQAMIEAGSCLDDPKLLKAGVSMLEWLVTLQTGDDGRASLVGNLGWATAEGFRARFDQQPLEVSAVIDACEAAYEATSSVRWFDCAKQFYLWFHGANDLSLSMHDLATGGCADGLHSAGANSNQGAESSLALFASTLSIQRLYAQAVHTTDRPIEPLVVLGRSA